MDTKKWILATLLNGILMFIVFGTAHVYLSDGIRGVISAAMNLGLAVTLIGAILFGAIKAMELD